MGWFKTGICAFILLLSSTLCLADENPWHNKVDPLDVNGNHFSSVEDFSQLLFHFQKTPPGPLGKSNATGLFIDVTNDWFFDGNDVTRWYTEFTGSLPRRFSVVNRIISFSSTLSSGSYTLSSISHSNGKEVSIAIAINADGSQTNSLGATPILELGDAYTWHLSNDSNPAITVDSGFFLHYWGHDCTCNGVQAVLCGTHNDEIIRAYKGATIVNGHGGNDLIYGTEQADYICTHDGDDTVYGRAGDDTVFGSNGNDTIYGGHGADTLWGGDGEDVLEGGNENDTIYGGHGDDIIRGGSDDDTIRGGTGADAIYGHHGNDLLIGQEGDDFISGNTGDDTIYGGSGNDTLIGGEDTDWIGGDEGDDLLVGHDGDGDVCHGGDHINGDIGHNSCESIWACE